MRFCRDAVVEAMLSSVDIRVGSVAKRVSFWGEGLGVEMFA